MTGKAKPALSFFATCGHNDYPSNEMSALAKLRFNHWLRALWPWLYFAHVYLLDMGASMPDPKLTQFTTETAKLAALKSAVARRPLDQEKDAVKAYNYAVRLLDLLAAQVFDPTPCKHCKRSPIDARTLDSLTKAMLTLIGMVHDRAWGKPATESRTGKAASLEDFKRARREVEHATDVPEDLPLAPDDATDDAVSQEADTLALDSLEQYEPQG